MKYLTVSLYVLLMSKYRTANHDRRCCCTQSKFSEDGLLMGPTAGEEGRGCFKANGGGATPGTVNWKPPHCFLMPLNHPLLTRAKPCQAGTAAAAASVGELRCHCQGKRGQKRNWALGVAGSTLSCLTLCDIVGSLEGSQRVLPRCDPCQFPPRKTFVNGHNRKDSYWGN